MQLIGRIEQKYTQIGKLEADAVYDHRVPNLTGTISEKEDENDSA